MKVLAIVGSPRKGKATDTLVDKAIEGVRAQDLECNVTKIHLADHDIHYCRNCLACRDAVTEGPIARCVIRDDMDPIYDEILKADALILGTPVHAGYPPALMTTFLERITWPFAKPEARVLTISGCPTPRSEKKRRFVAIVVSGIVPPLFRRFCDDTTKLLKVIMRDSLNAKMVGDLYAGDIEHRGVERYYDKAVALGRRLTRQ